MLPRSGLVGGAGQGQRLCGCRFGGRRRQQLATVSHTGGSQVAHQPRAEDPRRAQDGAPHTDGLVTPAGLVQEAGLDNWRQPLAAALGLPPSRPVIAALGKFDAMHKGHRALAAQAAALGGQPVLVSFWGMAEVLGWQRRPPLVAPCDRARVLASWAPACAGCQPRQRYLPFQELRGLSPTEFVAVLAGELGVAGVVVGANYRFGYRAAGDVAALQQLGAAAGLRVAVADLVGAGTPGLVGQVSSSRVREALAAGRLNRVRALLDRHYRLVARLPRAAAAPGRAGGGLVLGQEACLNQLPGPGRYVGDVALRGVAPPGQGQPPAAVHLGQRQLAASAEGQLHVALLAEDLDLAQSFAEVQLDIDLLDSVRPG